MQQKLCLLAVLLSGAALHAQQQQQQQQQQGRPPEQEKPHAYVRRFSAGATLSVLGPILLPGRTTNIVTTTPPVDSLYTTTPQLKRRVGFGFTGQVALTERFAVSSGVVMHWVGYQMTSDILEGTPPAAGAVDNRKHTVLNEDTRARLYDIPVALRYYGKDRHDPGPRWFVEGGGVLREVAGIRTQISTTLNANPTQCCNATPATPSHNPARGLVASAGLLLIDPVGIRVVPQVRYTHWLSDTFNTFSTATRRHEVEVMISLGF